MSVFGICGFSTGGCGSPGVLADPMNILDGDGIRWCWERRTPALRFGDPRVMVLNGALCQTLLAATGFTNKSLRTPITGLLGSDHRPNQMTYDLRRLRLAGLIPPMASTSPSPTPRSATDSSFRSRRTTSL